MRRFKPLITVLLVVLCLTACVFLTVACGDKTNSNDPNNNNNNSNINDNNDPNGPGGPDSGSVYPIINVEFSDITITGKMGDEASNARISYKGTYTIYATQSDVTKGNSFAQDTKECSFNYGSNNSADSNGDKLPDNSNKLYIDDDFKTNDGLRDMIFKDFTKNSDLRKEISAFNARYGSTVSESSIISYCGKVDEAGNLNNYFRPTLNESNFALADNENSPVEISQFSTAFGAFRRWDFNNNTFWLLNRTQRNLTAADCADLNPALYDNDGIKFIAKNTSIKIKEKGVWYKINFTVKAPDEHDSITLRDTDIYYATNLSDKQIYMESDKLTLWDGTELDKDMIVGAGTEGLKIKLYNDETLTDYEVCDVRVAGIKMPNDCTVTLPSSISVAEIDEKLTETVIELSYEDGKKITLTGDNLIVENLKLSYYGDMALTEYLKMKQSSSSPERIELSIATSLNSFSEKSVTVQVTLTEAFGYATFSNKSLLDGTMYEYQTFAVPHNLQITEHYYRSYEGYINKTPGRTETVDLYEGLFDELTDGPLAVGEKAISLVKDGMCSPEKCDTFTLKVLTDTVDEIEVELNPLFGGIIIGEPVDFTDCFIKVTFAHSQTTKLAMTENMLGELDEDALGEQNVEITYKEGVRQVVMYVRKVKSFTFYEGLDKTYMLNEEPDFDNVWLKVKFEKEEDDDYVRVPADRFESFDLSSEGSKSFSLTFGGQSKTHNYSVISGVYISYTNNGDSITLNSFLTGIPEEDSDAFVPEDPKNIVLPAAINGIPVTATAANLFKGQSILRSLVVPESITNVGAGLVDGCANLQKLTVSGSIQLKNYFTLYKAASFPNNPTYPNIPKKLEVVISGDSLCDDFLADLYCAQTNYIAKLTLGNNLTDLGTQSSFNAVKSFGDGGSADVYAKDDVIYTDSGATLYYYSTYKTTESFTIPNTVITANIERNDYITELTIPANVTTLCDNFAENCDALITVTFESGSQVTRLPNFAFDSCDNLTDFTFPENLEWIGVYVLGYCNIDTIILPQTVSFVGNGAFYNAKCTRFYIPTLATEYFVNNEYTHPRNNIMMPNLKAIAYDGSVALATLSMFADSFMRPTNIGLYITGEKVAIGRTWYSPAGAYIPSTIYVCAGTTFDKHYFNGYVYQEYGNPFEKWWLPDETL